MFFGKFGKPAGVYPGLERWMPPDADVDAHMAFGVAECALVLQPLLVLLLVG